MDGIRASTYGRWSDGHGVEDSNGVTWRGHVRGGVVSAAEPLLYGGEIECTCYSPRTLPKLDLSKLKIYCLIPILKTIPMPHTIQL